MSVEYARRGLIGLLTPQANTTVEPEYAILMPAGFTHINGRLLSDKKTIEERLVDYYASLDLAVRQFANAPIQALALGCTGASYLTGRALEEEILGAMTERLGVPVFSAATAVVDMLRAMGARRIALATPYPEALTEKSKGYWASHGLEVLAAVSATTDDAQFHPIYSLSAREAGGLLDGLTSLPGVQAVVMLGTGMPTLGPILKANGPGRVPVLSCMLALGWKGVEAISPGFASIDDWSRGTLWKPRYDLAMADPRPAGIQS